MFARTFTCRAGAAVRCSSRYTGGMPLRAKIVNPAFAGRAKMSTAAEDTHAEEKDTPTEKNDTPLRGRSEFTELPTDEKEDVLFNALYGLRTIELNRPKALHALNGSMIRKILPRLMEWRKSDMADVIVIKGSGPKALCAGGDVVALAKQNATGAEGQEESTKYFGLEYKLDHYIATYSKPYIAFMDGITMGGGVGLSIHAPFRIATERTMFAMPETTIGFFPDVGASFFLPRMDGAIGTYLALTSERLKGVDAFYSGIATHYIHSTSLHALEKRLAELRFKDWQPLRQRNELINATIEEYCTGLPHDQPMLISGELRNAIDRCFDKNSVTEIIRALKAEQGEPPKDRDVRTPLQKWADETLATLHQRSPTSVHVALRQMRLGKEWSISTTFKREYDIAKNFMQKPDFTEGVHALLIRKDGNPEWQPKTLEDIKEEDRIAEPYFLREENEESLSLLTDEDYNDYPFKFGLPREREIEGFIKETGMVSPGQVVNFFMQKTNGKQGVRESVTEVLQRKTALKEDGSVQWIDPIDEYADQD